MKKLLIFSLVLILIDQLTKFFMDGKKIFSGFISLNSIRNYGAAFGLFPGLGWLFIAVTLVVIIGVFYYYPKFKYKLGLIFLLSGSVGNLIDRVFLGYVRDFISVKYFSTFNLADCFNVIGVALVIYYSYKVRQERRKKNLNRNKDK